MLVVVVMMIVAVAEGVWEAGRRAGWRAEEEAVALEEKEEELGVRPMLDPSRRRGP